MPIETNITFEKLSKELRQVLSADEYVHTLMILIPAVEIASENFNTDKYGTISRDLILQFRDSLPK